MGFAGNQPNRKNIDFTPQASAPSDAVAGSTIYHSTSGLIFYTGAEWVATSGTGGASDFDGLTDVTLTSPTSGHIVKYNGTEWVNEVTGVPSGYVWDLVGESSASGGEITVSGLTAAHDAIAIRAEFIGVNGGSTEELAVRINGLSASFYTWNAVTSVDTDVVSSGGLNQSHAKLTASGVASNGLGAATNVIIECNDLDRPTGYAVYHTRVSSSHSSFAKGTSVGSFHYGLSAVDATRFTLMFDPAGSDNVTSGKGYFYALVPMKHAVFSADPTDLGDLTNVSTAGATTEDSLVYDGSSWVPSGVTGGAAALSGLTDVNTAGVTTADSLVYNGSNWVPSGVTGGGASALNDLTDVNTAGLATNEALVYNGSTWVPAPMDLATNIVGDLGEIDDVDVTGLANASGLSYNQATKVWEVTNFNLGHHTTGDIEDLDNVTLSTPASGNILQYNGTDWVNENVGVPSGYVWQVVDEVTLGSSSQTLTVSGIQSYPDAKEIKVEFSDVTLNTGDDLAIRIGTTSSILTASSYDWSSLSIQDSTSDSTRVNGDNQAHITAQSPAAVGTGGNTVASVVFKNPIRQTGNHPTFTTSVSAPDNNDTSQATHFGSFTYRSDVAVDQIQLTVDVDGSNTMAANAKGTMYALVPMKNAVLSASPTELNDLTDVNTAGLTKADSLVYNGSSWVPSGVTGGAASLAGLTDVTLTSEASGNLLQYNGSDWVNIESTPMDGYVWKVISQGTNTTGVNIPTIDFNGSGYKQIEVVMTNIDVTLDTYMDAMCVDSGGSEITGTDYKYTHVGGTTNASNSRIHASTAATSMVGHYAENSTNHIDTASDGRNAFKWTILNPSEHDASTPLHIQSEGHFYRTTGSQVMSQGSMMYEGSTVAHGINFGCGIESSQTLTCDYVVKALVPMNATAVFDIANLGDLTDVSAASPASGDMLKYNGSNWESYTTDAVQVDKIIQSVDGQSATADIETLDIANYSSQNVSRVEWYIFDIDVTADLSLELIAQTYVSDVVADNTGASDYAWHLDGGAGAGEFGQGDSADDSIFLSFNDSTTRYDTTVDGRGSARIIWVNPAEHMASPSTVPAHFEYSTSMIRPDGNMQSHYGHGFYYGATGTGDMCTAMKVKTSTSTFSCSHNVVVKIEKRL